MTDDIASGGSMAINQRTIEQSLAYAELTRVELPDLIQPTNADYDRVLMADEIKQLRFAYSLLKSDYANALTKIEELQCQLNSKKT